MADTVGWSFAIRSEPAEGREGGLCRSKRSITGEPLPVKNFPICRDSTYRALFSSVTAKPNCDLSYEGYLHLHERCGWAAEKTSWTRRQLPKSSPLLQSKATTGHHLTAKEEFRELPIRHTVTLYHSQEKLISSAQPAPVCFE